MNINTSFALLSPKLASTRPSPSRRYQSLLRVQHNFMHHCAPACSRILQYHWNTASLHAFLSLHSEGRLRFNVHVLDCSTLQHSQRHATPARLAKLPLLLAQSGACRVSYLSWPKTTQELTSNAWLLQTRAECHAARTTSACCSTVAAAPS
jgi:hypothetical protein